MMYRPVRQVGVKPSRSSGWLGPMRLVRPGAITYNPL